MFTEEENRNWKKLQRDLDSTVLHYLNDNSCCDIMLNSDGNLYIDWVKGGKKKEGFISRENAQMILNTMAYSLRIDLNEKNPVISGEIPVNGSRFEGNIPPIVTSPTFTIRKKSSLVYSLDDFVSMGTITQNQRKKLSEFARDRKNIVICGGTQSGKTTFANGILHEINLVDPDTRMLIIEDTRELQCSVKDLVSLRSTEHVTMQHLLKSALRQRPDRICVGEVRGGREALLLLEAWGTAHNGGLLTVHANSARSAIGRIEQLVISSGVTPLPAMIAEAVHVIVSIQKINGERKLRDILEVSYVHGNYVYKEV